MKRSSQETRDANDDVVACAVKRMRIRCSISVGSQPLVVTTPGLDSQTRQLRTSNSSDYQLGYAVGAKECQNNLMTFVEEELKEVQRLAYYAALCECAEDMRVRDMHATQTARDRQAYLFSDDALLTCPFLN